MESSLGNNYSIIFDITRIFAIIILVPLVGGLLSGIDRILTARMQSRIGPPVLQPFYDVAKLLQKTTVSVSPLANYFVFFALCFTIFTVVLFFMGGNFLLCIFAFTLACVFFVLSGYSSYSPYSFIGAERELLQIMCYEPMMLIFAFGYYKATGSFMIKDAITLSYPIIYHLPLIFLGFTYVLTIKLRKSPFDLSTSHHAHQEIVKGITTEFTGRTLAMVEIIHWYETVFALGMVYLFFINSNPLSWVIALILTLFIYFVEIVVDNAFARVRWQFALKLSWALTFFLGGTNLFILSLLN